MDIAKNISHSFSRLLIILQVVLIVKAVRILQTLMSNVYRTINLQLVLKLHVKLNVAIHTRFLVCQKLLAAELPAYGQQSLHTVKVSLVGLKLA